MPNVNPREKGKPFSNSSFRSSFDPAKFQGGRKIFSLSSSAEKKRNEEAIESLNSVTETKRRGMKTRRDNANKEEGRRGMKRCAVGSRLENVRKIRAKERGGGQRPAAKVGLRIHP